MSLTPSTILWVRESVPRETHRKQCELIARLDTLEREKVIQSLEVRTWSQSVFESTSWIDEEVSHAIDQLRDFTEATEIERIHGFETNSTATVDGETIQRTQLPVLCLALYTEDVLQFVAPCTIGNSIMSVPDLITRLEEGKDYEEMRSVIYAGSLD